jgi:hypothetical protein
MEETKSTATFSNPHDAAFTGIETPYAVLKKLTPSEKSCPHRTITGFCTRSNKKCPAIHHNSK